MRYLYMLLVLFVSKASTHAQIQPEWLRYPAISPNGQTIAFTYKGNIYTVPTKGGTAIPLTLHTAQDFMPVWSPDGQSIAFASDRNGNFDVYIMPSTGGIAQQLTYYSAPEYPYSFTPDGKQVVYGSTRQDEASNRQFPTGSMPELYSVPTVGGRSIQLLTTPAEDVCFSADGNKMYYHDKKGGENQWRKHHTSSVTRDIWEYNKTNGQHTKLTSFNGEDRTPVLANNGQTIFYLSEAKGSFNVFKMQSNGSNPTQVTAFNTHPVRFLTAAQNGLLCFGYDGQIYTQQNGLSQKVTITINTDDSRGAYSTISVGGSISNMQISPNEKEVAFIFRGDVFVTNIDGASTKQITQTTAQETDISWMADGRSLVYSSERNNKWSIFKSEIVRSQEPYFYASTLVKETPLLGATTGNPKISPNGKEMAYIENYNTLKIYNFASKQSRSLITQKEWVSWGDGGHDVSWSPDGKWLLIDYAQQGIGKGEVGIISTETGKNARSLTNITQNGFDDGNAKWMVNGKVVLWTSNRDGLSAKANSGGGQQDVYALFLDKEVWDDFKLSKEDAALAKEIKDKAAKADSSKKSTTKKDSIAPINIQWDGLEYRKARLTIHSSTLADAVINQTGDILYYLASFEKGYNLWSTNLRTKETKILAPLNTPRASSLQWDKAYKKLYVQTSTGISKIEVASGKTESVAIKGDMRIDEDAERINMFNHVWRTTQDVFYTTGFHGANWESLCTSYQKYLPHIGTGFEFAEMLNELLGELNVSHCYAMYNSSVPNSNQTASLGLLYNMQYSGEGMQITEVLKEGPLDRADITIKPGTILEAIDGDTLKPNIDIAALLNLKAGKNVLLSLLVDGKRSEVVVQPVSIGQENGMLYKRWVKRNALEVDSLSNGTLGYIHIPGMNDGAYRTAIEDAMGKYASRKALVVDTRNNGGGDLVADLAMWLSGKKFMEYTNDKESFAYEPTFRWTKPSISLANEANYSDGHCYAFTYQYLQLGKLVGMPVPGTCTFAGWQMLQDGKTRWGVPPMGVKTLDGRYLENLQTEPDILIANSYKQVAAGTDEQLEKAVSTLMQQLK